MNDTELCRHLWCALDDIGVSDDIKHSYRDWAIRAEIQATALRNYTCSPHEKYSYYLFGSSSEGTTSPNLQSDFDTLISYDHIQVIEDINNAQDGLCFLIVTDQDIKPGYVRLQPVLNGEPQTVRNRAEVAFEGVDKQGRLCFKHIYQTTDFSPTRNGPADTIFQSNDLLPSDVVFAVKFPEIPKSANSWLTRDRSYNWPPKEQLDAMESFGCFFVGVGHPKSCQKEIEWRISFSRQERILMFTLNETQHKCYVLLKMIKNDIIECKAGKSFSSYHCKTSLFYTIENSPHDIWRPNNIIQCTFKCIEYLLRWVRERNCPNYFIPEENMFDRLAEKNLENVSPVLDDILGSWPKCLFSLTGGLPGSFLSLPQVRGVTCLKRRSVLMKLDILAIDYGFNSNLIKMLSKYETPEGCLAEAKAFLQYLELTFPFSHTDYSFVEIKKVVDPQLPLLHLQIAQCLCVIALEHAYTHYRGAISSEIYLRVKSVARHADILADMLVATYYIRLEMFRVGSLVLSKAYNEIVSEPHFQHCCCCSEMHARGKSARLQELVYDTKNPKSLCLTFFTCQSNLVHPTLRYEMYRSVYTTPGSRDIIREDWFDCIVVDPHVYLYFLQYIIHRRTRDLKFKLVAINSLQQLVDESLPVFGHLDTAYNLLGWIYVQENKIEDAWKCFCLSWSRKPFHNAAKWHMILLLHTVYDQLELLYRKVFTMQEKNLRKYELM